MTYHHILSPETGYPVETDLVSVTVYAPGGLNSDALSTACFINGLNPQTLQWLQNFSAEAVFVNKDKEYYVTDGLSDALDPQWLNRIWEMIWKRWQTYENLCNQG